MEWKLCCVLPDIPSDQEQTEQDIQECLTIHPSEKSGNGIFLANFQLKPLVVEVHRHEDPLTLAKRLSEQSINALEQQMVEIPMRKKKSKKQGRKKGEPLKIRLPKAMRASVERLSMPRNFVLEQKAVVAIEKPKSAGKQVVTQTAEDNDLALEECDDEAQDAELKEEKQDVDITVFGMSVNKFYAPRKVALEALKKKKETPAVQMRWSFPVPNPTVWK